MFFCRCIVLLALSSFYSKTWYVYSKTWYVRFKPWNRIYSGMQKVLLPLSLISPPHQFFSQRGEITLIALFHNLNGM